MTSEETWIVRILMKAQLIEDGFNFHIPMLWTAPKPIQHALEEPAFILVASGSPMGGLTIVILLGGRIL